MSASSKSKTSRAAAGAPASRPKKPVQIIRALITYSVPQGAGRPQKRAELQLLNLNVDGASAEQNLKYLAMVYMRLHGLPSLVEGAEKLIEDMLRADWRGMGFKRELRFKLTEEKEVSRAGGRNETLLTKAIYQLVEDGQRQRRVIDYPIIVDETFTVTYPSNPERTKTRLEKHRRLVRAVLRYHFPALSPGKKGGK